MGTNSLLVVPAGFNTLTDLAACASLGLTHTAGSTLVIPANQGFSGGILNDPVVCQGFITAGPNRAINLSNGIQLSGTGAVNLGTNSPGNGGLTVNDAVLGMTGGTLNLTYFYVGKSGSGVFQQSGGGFVLTICISVTIPETAGPMSLAAAVPQPCKTHT